MNNFTPIQKLEVFRRLADGNKVKVGILAQNKNAVYFQYDIEYLKASHNLSPFKLSFNGKLQEAIKLPHQGLQGVFADSLPDGWGLLLMDRIFRRHGVLPQQLTMMDRLAYIGDRGMGALEYAPISAYAPKRDNALINIYELGQEAQEIFEGQTNEVLTQLANAGSSGGARPKAQIYIHPDNLTQANTIYQEGLQPWLVKFTSQSLALGHEESLCEAAYLKMAHHAGIDVPEYQLITPPQDSNAIAWLALRRFDCTDKGRYHLHSLCGLLDADFRTPSLDYDDIIKASQVLCNSPAVGQTMFARAIFNLFSLNQDDHSKNWAFLMDDIGKWKPSPFYDITFSPNPHNEHSTAFMGYGNTPPLKAIQQMAKQANFGTWKQAQEVIQKIVNSIQEWHQISSAFNISLQTRNMIEKQLKDVWQQNKKLCV